MAASKPSFSLSRLAAILLFVVSGLGLLYAGLASVNTFFPSLPALAEQNASSGRKKPGQVTEADRARLLQSSVDSVALSLGGIFSTLSDDKDRQTALATALNSLTFELGGEIYFTAWNGTRILHSPLTPDTEDIDFATARDQNGTPFVMEMERIAHKGGGFIHVTLPRQKDSCLVSKIAVPSLSWDAEPAFSRLYGTDPFNFSKSKISLPEIMASRLRATAALLDPLLAPVALGALNAESDALPAPRLSRDDFTLGPQSPDAAQSGLAEAQNGALPAGPAATLPGMAPPPAIMDTEPVEQLLYVRSIPRSNWHIAAFMPTMPEQPQVQGFSPAFADPAPPASPAPRQEEGAALEKGLLISVLSLAGLATLAVISLSRRKKTSS